jgi:hypothetical protein
MPAIDIGALFIGRGDQEGNNGSGVVMEYDDDIDAKTGGVRAPFLGGRPPPTLGRAFREERMTTKTTEMSRDDEHKEDVMTRSMFEMLCEGEPWSS